MLEARCHLKAGKKAEADQVFIEIISNWPDSFIAGRLNSKSFQESRHGSDERLITEVNTILISCDNASGSSGSSGHSSVFDVAGSSGGDGGGGGGGE